MDTLISNSVQETQRLGRAWGAAAQCGWVYALRGEMGAGKTHLVQGIAAGLGVTDRVHSPTFALLHEYLGGPWPLYHLDLYRLENRASILAAGLEDYLSQPPGVTVVEWAERWFGNSASDAAARLPRSGFLRWVELEHLDENTRQIRYEDLGS